MKQYFKRSKPKKCKPQICQGPVILEKQYLNNVFLQGGRGKCYFKPKISIKSWIKKISLLTYFKTFCNFLRRLKMNIKTYRVFCS